jgi:hypothetical protein
VVAVSVSGCSQRFLPRNRRRKAVKQTIGKEGRQRRSRLFPATAAARARCEGMPYPRQQGSTCGKEAESTCSSARVRRDGDRAMEIQLLARDQRLSKRDQGVLKRDQDLLKRDQGVLGEMRRWSHEHVRASGLRVGEEKCVQGGARCWMWVCVRHVTSADA